MINGQVDNIRTTYFSLENALAGIKLYVPTYGDVVDLGNITVGSALSSTIPILHTSS